jgi:bidirectional [NiFe] hydrogenase diaphorase subunit
LSGEITLQINGKEVKAERGMTILQAAKTAGIEIPTLCYNEKLKPYGACRMCTVEIKKGERTRLVTSCIYPAEEGLVVNTETERVNKIRRMILELLLPKVSLPKMWRTEPIKTLAKKYNLKTSRFSTKPTNCILCGICVRYCAEIRKENAITFVGRGINRHRAFVSEAAANKCIECRECFDLCPTGIIEDAPEKLTRF